jgi:hypothetical protein
MRLKDCETIISDILPKQKYPASIKASVEEGCKVENGSGYCEGEAIRYFTPIKVERVTPEEFKLVEEAKKTLENAKILEQKQKSLMDNMQAAGTRLGNRICNKLQAHIKNHFKQHPEPECVQAMLEADYQVEVQCNLIIGEEERDLGCLTEVLPKL